MITDQQKGSSLKMNAEPPSYRESLTRVVSTLLTAVFCSLFFSANSLAARPNIVFIIADDLGWADVDFHGGNVPTPNLNRLLSDGIELRQHYVAPVCSPTRTGFMTGRYWSRFGVTTPTNSLALPFDTVTTADALHQAGYQTCITGKWHLGSKPEWGPNHFGFDHSYGSMAGGVTPWSHRYKKGPYSVTWHRNESLITEEGHVTDLLANEAVRWLENCDEEKPCFLYVPFTAVHLPIREPEKWESRVPQNIVGEVPRHYAACVLHLDDAVGRIIATVERIGLSKNTMIVFTSDNGGSTAENNDLKYPNIGDDCPSGKLPGNNLPLRGKKGDLYEGGTRVPTIVRLPGRIKAGSFSETPVHIVDWMPTFLALAGHTVDVKKMKWDGMNIWPVLSGSGELPNRPLYSAGTHFRSQALRHGDWKLIVFTGTNGAERKVELFNISKDPNEKNNLADSNPEKVAELKKELASAAANDRDSLAQSRPGH
jgi:arylsulfatase I/J